MIDLGHAEDFEKLVRHGLTMVTIELGDRHTWMSGCICGEHFLGFTYEVAEDYWREHLYDATGKTAPALGNQENRWSPDAIDSDDGG